MIGYFRFWGGFILPRVLCRFQYGFYKIKVGLQRFVVQLILRNCFLEKVEEKPYCRPFALNAFCCTDG